MAGNGYSAKELDDMGLKLGDGRSFSEHSAALKDDYNRANNLGQYHKYGDSTPGTYTVDPTWDRMPSQADFEASGNYIDPYYNWTQQDSRYDAAGNYAGMSNTAPNAWLKPGTKGYTERITNVDGPGGPTEWVFDPLYGWVRENSSFDHVSGKEGWEYDEKTKTWTDAEGRARTFEYEQKLLKEAKEAEEKKRAEEARKRKEAADAAAGSLKNQANRAAQAMGGIQAGIQLTPGAAKPVQPFIGTGRTGTATVQNILDDIPKYGQ